MFQNEQRERGCGQNCIWRDIDWKKILTHILEASTKQKQVDYKEDHI